MQNMVLNIGTGNEVSLLEIIEILSKISKKSVEINFLAKRSGDIMRSLADNNTMLKYGLSCQYDINKGLSDYLNKLDTPI